MNDALNIALQKLRSSDPAVREEALDCIGDLNPTNAHLLIAPLVEDAEASVRSAAACNLGVIANHQSAPLLLRLAENDPSNEVREEAIASLGNYHNQQVHDFLVRHAGQSGLRRRARQEIAKQLGTYNTDQSAAALRLLTKDNDAFVRDFALESMRDIFALPTDNASCSQLEQMHGRFVQDAEAMWEAKSFPASAYCWMQAAECRQSIAKLVAKSDAFAGVRHLVIAAECFIKAAVMDRAKTAVHLLTSFKSNKTVSSTDLLASINACELQFHSLEQHFKQFAIDFKNGGHILDVANQDTENFLLGYLSVLPGLSHLHYAIFRQSSLLDHPMLAAEHLLWAAAFDSTNANLAALLGFALITREMHDRAAAIGRNFLSFNAGDNAQVRVMVAFALSTREGANNEDFIQAKQILAPIISAGIGSKIQRTIAIVLTATCESRLGHEDEFLNWRNQLHEMAYSEEPNGAAQVANELWTIMPDSTSASFEKVLERIQRISAPDMRPSIAQFVSRTNILPVTSHFEFSY